MKSQSNTALVKTCKPQFFKVLYPDPFANLMIPRKFHVNLPHKLQKLATLFSPAGKFWHVEIYCTGEDMYFQKGWSEFAKAHNLQTGYFMVFRYEGNMIFKVKIFDSTGCLKDYSPASHACLAIPYIEIESSSETRDQSSKESSHEFKSDHLKKRKLADGQALEIDKRKGRSTSQETLKEEKDTKDGNADSNRQFEKILRRYYTSHQYIHIPKKFCVNNGLKTGHTVYLKDNSSGGRLWPVSLCLRPNGGQLNKGWNEFADATGLKEGDLCIFRLESKNILVVTVESNSRRERKQKATEGSTSSVVALDEKQIQQNKQYSRPTLKFKSNILHKRKFTNGQTLETDERNTGSTSLETLKEKKDPKEENVDSNICSRQFERILMPYCFSSSRLFISKAFCLNNGLLTRHTIYLKENSTGGRSWPVNLGNGYLTKGWKEFREAAGLKEGDRCIFRLVSESSLVVTVIPQESDSTRERKGKAIEGFTSSVVAKEEKQIQKKKQYSRLIIREGKAIKWESTVRPYHLTYSYQNLGKTFCLDNNLISPRDITLRDLTGKEWHAKFYFNKNEGRLDRAGWSDFSREHRLNVGDKCIFEVVQEDVLLIRVIKI